MASFFVAMQAPGGAAHAVHDRSRCAPDAFPCQAEYLGEFFDAGQAVAVARLRYLRVCLCPCCVPPRAQAPRAPRAVGALSSLRF